MADETIKYASVTSLTGLLPKNLVWWAGNAVADCAFNKQDEWRHLPTRDDQFDYVKRAHQRIKDNAADLGSEVHKFVEAMNLGKSTPAWPLPVKARMTHFASFMDDFSPRVEAAETKVYSRTHGYAGTADLFAEIDGQMAVLDVKTGKSVWPEAALQIAAYARADFLVADPNHPGAVQENKRGQRRMYTWTGPPEDEMPLPKATIGYVLHLRDDGYDLHPVPDLDAAFEMFLALLPIDRWERELKKTVLGKPLPKSDAYADAAIAEFSGRAA
jgi:hypothetical protein